MPIFAVTYRYSDDITTEHRDDLRGLADQNVLLVSGPFGPTDPAGALHPFTTSGATLLPALPPA
jgi:uncharacterized protein